MSRNVTPTGGRRPTFETLAERLWWSRETAPLTQAQLAARLGISKRTVQHYEHGAESPKENRLVLWANACDVDVDWLAGDFYEMQPSARSGPPRRKGTRPDNHEYRRPAMAA